MISDGLLSFFPSRHAQMTHLSCQICICIPVLCSRRGTAAVMAIGLFLSLASLMLWNSLEMLGKKYRGTLINFFPTPNPITNRCGARDEARVGQNVKKSHFFVFRGFYTAFLLFLFAWGEFNSFVYV